MDHGQEASGEPPAARPQGALTAKARRLLTVRRVVFLSATAACLAAVLLLYGFFPGSSQVPLTVTFGVGAIQCLHDQGIASLWTWCMSLGAPIGFPSLTGLPVVYLGWVISYVPGFDAWHAHQWSNALVTGLAFWGSYRLLRRWQAPAWISLVTTTSYLVTPNVLVLNGFVYTFTGFSLLPCYVFLGLRLMDAMVAGRWWRACAGALGLAVVMAFMDGYSFICAASVLAVLTVHRSVRLWRSGRRARGCAVAALWPAAIVAAAGLYLLWAPEDAFRSSAGLATFAHFGIDLTTLFMPTSVMLLPALLGGGTAPTELWGSSPSIRYNYVGVLCLVLSLGLLAWLALVRRRRATDDRMNPGAGPHEAWPVAVAGIAALVLSLGPVLKIGQSVPELGAAVAALPTAWAFENVPGLSEMRAVHRWFVVVRWSLLSLAAVALGVLWDRVRGKGWVARVGVVVLCLLTFAEVAPNAVHELRLRSVSVERLEFLRDGIVAEADVMIDDGERILMLPSGNDFLANYLVPLVGATSYNAGGDKNYALAVAHWPDTVLAARATYGPRSAAALCDVLRDDVDAVVLPHMSSFYGPLLWGNTSEVEDELRRWASQLAQDHRFEARTGEWLTVLRAADGSCTDQ